MILYSLYLTFYINNFLIFYYDSLFKHILLCISNIKLLAEQILNLKNINTFYSCKVCTSDQSKADLQSVENALGLSKGPILGIFQANSFCLLHTQQNMYKFGWNDCFSTNKTKTKKQADWPHTMYTSWHDLHQGDQYPHWQIQHKIIPDRHPHNI